MKNKETITLLPNKRTGKLISLLERNSFWRIFLTGILIYLGIVLFITTIEYFLHVFGYDYIYNCKNLAANSYSDFMFFNLFSILTISYGDFHPVFLGRLFSIIEAFLGVGVFSALVSIIIVKALLPPQNTIVFSKYGYYCTNMDPQCFLIIFVNTSNTNLGNVEISSYFKLGGDWEVKPAITSPFITQAVQTFYLDTCSEKDIIDFLRDGDCLRVGMVGGLGFTSFSTFIQYDINEILVIPDRSKLIEYFEPLGSPDFSKNDFRNMFDYCPKEAITLRKYVDKLKDSQEPA
jgi:hypothetical protein